MSKRASAWVMDISEYQTVSLGTYLIRELIGVHEKNQYPLYFVPMAPGYCPYLMHWRGLLIPVMNFGMLFQEAMGESAEEKATAAFSIVVVVIPPDEADAEGELQYGAIKILGTPQSVDISNENQCNYPDQIWTNFACSCFEWGEKAVPVIDPQKIFSKPTLANCSDS